MSDPVRLSANQNSKFNTERDLSELLSQVFTEINSFFGEILKRGLVSISTSDISRYLEFKARLEKIGAEKFLLLFQTFIDKSETVIQSKNQRSILDLIDAIMKILIYIRTYERVSSQYNVIEQLNALISQEST